MPPNAAVPKRILLEVIPHPPRRSVDTHSVRLSSFFHIEFSPKSSNYTVMKPKASDTAKIRIRARQIGAIHLSITT